MILLNVVSSVARLYKATVIPEKSRGSKLGSSVSFTNTMLPDNEPVLGFVVLSQEVRDRRSKSNGMIRKKVKEKQLYFVLFL